MCQGESRPFVVLSQARLCYYRAGNLGEVLPFNGQKLNLLFINHSPTPFLFVFDSQGVFCYD